MRKGDKRARKAIELRPHLIRRPTSTTTDWVSNRRDGWTSAITRFAAGMITAQSAAKTSVSRSWFRLAVMDLFGTIHRKQRWILDSTIATCGHRMWETACRIL